MSAWDDVEVLYRDHRGELVRLAGLLLDDHASRALAAVSRRLGEGL